MTIYPIFREKLIATQIFITAGGGRWSCSRLSPVCPCVPIYPLSKLTKLESYGIIFQRKIWLKSISTHGSTIVINIRFVSTLLRTWRNEPLFGLDILGANLIIDNWH